MRHLLAAAFGLLLWFGGGEGSAQEAIRSSLAGQDAAEARRRAAGSPGYYNLKMGDWRLRFQSGVGLEYDDNVRLEDTEVFRGTNRFSNTPESDFILRPSLQLFSTVPISRQNTLDLGLGVGYSYYLDSQDLNRLFLSPNSGFSFDIYVNDWLINLHDRVTVSEESAASVSVSGTGNYGYLENTAGVSGTWDLNRLLVELNYDYLMRVSTTSGFDQQNTDQHLFRSSLALKLDNVSSAGVEATVGLISYDESILSGGIQYSAGLFYRRQLGRHFSLQAAAGYFIYTLDDLGTNSLSTNTTFKAQDQIDGMYGMVGLAHRVNPVFGYRLDAGRQFQVGLFSDTLDLYYVRLGTEWNVIRKMPISASFSYENGDEANGLQEKIERLGGALSISRALTEKLSASLSYSIYSRTSDQPGRNYLQNRVSLTASYRF